MDEGWFLNAIKFELGLCRPEGRLFTIQSIGDTISNQNARNQFRIENVGRGHFKRFCNPSAAEKERRVALSSNLISPLSAQAR